jgi:hypothetical protein
VLLHAGALNLGLLLRTLFGVGTPRSLQGRVMALLAHSWSLIRGPESLLETIATTYRRSTASAGLGPWRERHQITRGVAPGFATGCQA